MAEVTEGRIIPVNIEEEMNDPMDYAMSVIVRWAIPDVRTIKACSPENFYGCTNWHHTGQAVRYPRGLSAMSWEIPSPRRQSYL